MPHSKRFNRARKNEEIAKNMFIKTTKEALMVFRRLKTVFFSQEDHREDKCTQSRAFFDSCFTRSLVFEAFSESIK